MKFFGRSPGCWLFWISFLYAIVGLVNIFVYKFTEIEYLQVAYLVILSTPLFLKPLASWLNMKTLWEL